MVPPNFLAPTPTGQGRHGDVRRRRFSAPKTFVVKVVNIATTTTRRVDRILYIYIVNGCSYINQKGTTDCLFDTYLIPKFLVEYP